MARPEAALTPRQTQLLDYCITAGYYEIPRHMTLAELADRFGISAPSLSVSLRRAENRLVKANALARHGL